MYQVFKNKRVVSSINKQGPFFSFEEARQALRRYIRKHRDKLVCYDFGCWDGVSRNPTRYTTAGFSIRKVA